MVIAFKNDRISLMEDKERALRADISTANETIQQLERAKQELANKITTMENELLSAKSLVETKEFEIRRRDEVIKQYEDQSDAKRIELQKNLDKAKKIKDLEEINLLITSYRRQQIYE
jgi:hypothetical protein